VYPRLSLSYIDFPTTFPLSLVPSTVLGILSYSLMSKLRLRETQVIRDIRGVFSSHRGTFLSTFLQRFPSDVPFVHVALERLRHPRHPSAFLDATFLSPKLTCVSLCPTTFLFSSTSFFPFQSYMSDFGFCFFPSSEGFPSELQ